MNLIVTNANVITLDEQSSRAQAMAILGRRIIRVGTNEEAMSMAVDPVTVLDLQGKTVVPGFVESHVHPVMAAHYNLEMVNCGTPPNRTIADIVEKLGEAAKQAGRGEWISGRGFDDSLVEDMRHITRQDMDAATPNNPVYISYVAGHLSYANSRALELAGVTRSTPDPVEGASTATPAATPPACCTSAPATWCGTSCRSRGSRRWWTAWSGRQSRC